MNVEPDDTQEFDPAAFDDVIEDAEPLPAEQIAPSPYTDGVSPSDGPQDDVP